MQNFDFILNHCDRNIQSYKKLQENLIKDKLSPNGAIWVQEELQIIKHLIQTHQELEAEKMANFFGEN